MPFESGDGNGGDLLVSLLEHLGTTAAFGVVSVHNLALVDALGQQLRWVPTRGEAGAVNAADGYSRVSGGLGCAVTSTGTGAGNAAGSLVEALSASTPLLHVTGQIDREHLGLGRGVIHETRDQLAMLDACSVWAATVGTDPSRDFRSGVHHARSHPRGPVSLEWPVDAQFGRYPIPDWQADEDALPAPGQAIDGDLDRTIDLLRSARRPLVWAGGGATTSRTAMGEFLDRIGAGLFTSNAGRGVLPEDDERCLGNFAATDTGAELLAAADLLISFGTHFRSNETRSYRLNLPANHIQVDVDRAALGRSYPCEIGLEATTETVLGALLGVGDLGPVDPDWAQRIAAARAASRAQLRADIGPYADICDTINDVLDPTDPRVRDITIPNSAWGNRLLHIDDPHTNVYPRGGGIGQALGLGLGSAIARPDSATMIIIGDGGLQVQLGELATIAEEQAPATIVVFDDGGYGVLRNMQDRHLGRRSGVDLYTPSIQHLASAHDLPYQSVASPADFASAFAAGVETGAPNIIRVDCDGLGPMPKPFTPPVAISVQ